MLGSVLTFPIRKQRKSIIALFPRHVYNPHTFATYLNLRVKLILITDNVKRNNSALHSRKFLEIIFINRLGVGKATVEEAL